MRNISTLLLFSALTTACEELPNCYSDSPRAKFAYSLSKEQYADIYDTTVQKVEKKFGKNLCCGRIDPDELPENMAFLNLRTVNALPHIVLLRLEGCFDHHLDFVVVRDTDNSGRLELWSGEGRDAKKEILWSAGEA
jgi:hypothetical protein